MPTLLPPPVVRILIVDDHPIVRFGFIALLRQTDDSWLFEEAEGPADAIEAVRRTSPRIAIVDLSLAGVLSLELIKRIRVLSPETAILVVSMHDEKHYAARSLRAGAKGYVMKQIAAKSISQAVQRMLEGKIWLSEEAQAHMINCIADDADSVPGFDALSGRELAVFRLIGMGMRKGDIGRELKISPNTVETYRANIKQKMGLASGSELFRIAFMHVQENVVAKPGATNDEILAP